MAMFDSLRSLADLGSELLIYPGHSYGGNFSTIGKEKATGLLQNMSREKWASMMAQ